MFAFAMDFFAYIAALIVIERHKSSCPRCGGNTDHNTITEEFEYTYAEEIGNL